MAGINRTIAVLAIAVWGLMVVGCASAKPYHGQWRGEISGEMNNPDSINAQALRRVDLTIAPDSTFEAVISGFPYTGNTRVTRDAMFLDVKQIMGKPVESFGPDAVRNNQPYEIRLDGNGTATLTDPTGGFSPVKLNRVQP